jgi:hypothetical protein
MTRKQKHKIRDAKPSATAQQQRTVRTVLDPDNDFQAADVYARRLRGSSEKTIELQPAIVFDFAEAQGIVDALLVDAWVMRERAELTLPPSTFAIEPTDVVNLDLNGRIFEMRADSMGFEYSRPAKLVRTDEATYGTSDGPPPTRQPKPISEPGPALLEVMDLPILTPTEVPGAPRLAAYAEPWARVNVFRSPANSGYLWISSSSIVRQSAGRCSTSIPGRSGTGTW